MDVSTLLNYVNLCFDFLLRSLFDSVLLIIVVHGNNINDSSFELF